jgi:hypothetical protein
VDRLQLGLWDFGDNSANQCIVFYGSKIVALKLNGVFLGGGASCQYFWL